MSAWLFLGSTILFYMYQYLLRSAPAAMHHAWSQDFQISATQFASIGAIYLYAYGLLQIPIGWALDRMGIKRILLFSVAICTFGAFLLGIADSFWMIQLSRLCLGIGSATPFICAMKIIQDRFPEKRQGLLCGLTLTVGIMGAMCAGLPLQLMVEQWGWQMAAQTLAAIGAAVFLAISLVMRKTDSARRNTSSFSFSWKDAFQWPVLRYGLITIGLYAPLSVLVDLWGTAFLTLKYGVSREEIASATMSGYLGLAIGSAVLPLIARSRDLHKLVLASLIAISFFLGWILFAPPLSLPLLATCFLLLGFSCGSLMLCYPAIGLYTTAHNSGFVFGFANTILMLGEGALNLLAGFLIDVLSRGDVSAEGIPVYSAFDYQNGLGLVLFPVLVLSMVSLWLSMRSREVKV